jgi:hypothetical protein
MYRMRQSAYMYTAREAVQLRGTLRYSPLHALEEGGGGALTA